MAGPDDHVMLLSTGGIAIRIAASQISLIGRDTQGVTLMKLGANDAVATMTIVPAKEEGDGLDPSLGLNGHEAEITEQTVTVVPPGMGG
jgi:DNA gyrase subunit A